MNERVHVWVQGHVQGVYFRLATQREANANNVKGWVRNCKDGRVEAVFEGEGDAVRRMVAFCRDGPPGARVERIDVEREDYTGEERGFTILYW